MNNSVKPKRKKKKKESVVEQVRKVSKKKVKHSTGATVPTGITLIDLLAGDYEQPNTLGVPVGIINIVGDSSSGKSYISGEILSAIYHHHKGKIGWYYDNVEKGYKINSKGMYGFDILKDGFFPDDEDSETIQDFEYKINEIISAKDKKLPFVYIVDSFDAISSDAEIKFMKKKRGENKKKKEGNEDLKEAGSYNLEKQKFMHQFCRTYTKRLISHNIYLIIVSQVKDNIGVMFGAKQKRLGGSALNFYPNFVMWLSDVGKVLKKGRAVRSLIKARSTKSRSKTPFRTAFIDLVYDYGIDNISSNIKFLYDLKTDSGKDKSKAKITWDEKEFKKVEKLVSYIEDNNLEKELEERVIEKWAEIEESISSKGRKSKWN